MAYAKSRPVRSTADRAAFAVFPKNHIIKMDNNYIDFI